MVNKMKIFSNLKGKIKKKTIINITTIFICVLMLCPMVHTFAASTILLKYRGVGICNKKSNDTFSLSKNTNINVVHNTTSWYKLDGRKTSDLYVKVALQKKEWLFFHDTGNSFKKYSTGKVTHRFTEDEGTYRLYFTTNQYKANICGYVKK